MSFLSYVKEFIAFDVVVSVTYHVNVNARTKVEISPHTDQKVYDAIDYTEQNSQEIGY